MRFLKIFAVFLIYDETKFWDFQTTVTYLCTFLLKLKWYGIFSLNESSFTHWHINSTHTFSLVPEPPFSAFPDVICQAAVILRADDCVMITVSDRHSMNMMRWESASLPDFLCLWTFHAFSEEKSTRHPTTHSHHHHMWLEVPRSGSNFDSATIYHSQFNHLSAKKVSADWT